MGDPSHRKPRQLAAPGENFLYVFKARSGICAYACGDAQTRPRGTIALAGNSEAPATTRERG